MEAQSLIMLPFDSPLLARVDGMAMRADWQPTQLHQQFMALLREHAREYENTVVPATRARRMG
jgi:hypothetical protein